MLGQILLYSLSLSNILAIIFGVYLYFRNPQIKTDQEDIRVKSEIEAIKKQIQEIKETHLKTVEQDLKSLTQSVNELSKTVVRLATIIDERIPRLQN